MPQMASGSRPHAPSAASAGCSCQLNMPRGRYMYCGYMYSTMAKDVSLDSVETINQLFLFLKAYKDKSPLLSHFKLLIEQAGP